MPALTDKLDLGSLHLSAGEGRRLELAVEIEPLMLGGERYVTEPPQPAVTLEVSRMVGHGYALRLRFAAALAGPCMRCLGHAAPMVEVDAREVDRPGGGEDLEPLCARGDARPGGVGPRRVCVGRPDAGGVPP